MKNIRLKWRVEKNDILFFLAMAVGVWLFGRILSETSARYSLRIGTEFLGTAFLALGMGLVLIIWLVADFYLSFQLAVGFGQTRTEFLISSTISYFVYIMFNLFLLRFLFEIEKNLVQGTEAPVLLEKYGTPLWLLCYGILFVIAAELMGTMIYYLRVKSIIILLPLEFLVIFAVREDKFVRQIKTAFLGFADFSGGVRLLLVALISIIGFCITFFGMKKAQNY
ncbi:hypothetical protein HMPREF0992_01923 [Lachnospiraceae bacterium 6_1_63FAA]|nr:hypothetical protein HMPREF0992_01923 [Lachnospiraceae bacterium 6_1_63FAA]